MQHLHLLGSLAARLTFCLLLVAPAAGATTTDPMCSQPSSNGVAPVASDCLFILKVAVGLESCSPECICAPKGTLPTSASDALLCLNFAVGQPVALDCPCDGGGGGGGGPILPTEVLGIVSASYNTNPEASPQFFTANGVTPVPAAEMDLGGAFAIINGIPTDPGSTTTVEEIAGCTVVTFEQVTEFGGFGIIGPPDFTPLDPGNPGTADNGSVEIDMVSTGFGGYEPEADVLASGYGAGQTITFSWPGGTDIDAFSGDIEVPGAVNLTEPDLADPGFDIIAGQALDVAWIPDPDDDGNITATASTSINDSVFDMGSGMVTITVVSISVACEFADNAGSGTMPAAAMAELQSMAPLTATFTKSFSASRENYKTIPVTPTIEGRSAVGLVGSSSTSRSITVGFALP